jgi:peptide/nickel transport system substrate-binding protein
MKNLRWQLLVVFIALIVIAILLLGQKNTLLQGIEPVAGPVSGGIYTEGVVGEFGRLNPLLDYYSPIDYEIDRLIFSGLVRFDSRGMPQGDLADAWGISQDGKVYNFSIRKNASWQDGELVTSDDIIFTVSLLQDPKNPLPLDLRAFWRQVEVKALDEKIVQFRLPEAFAPFLDYLTFGVLPEHILKGKTAEQLINDPFNLNPIGSGPFQFKNLETIDGKVDSVVLNTFRGYYGNVPFIDQVVFRFYPDAAAALFAYKQGEITGISELTPEVLSEALKDNTLNIFSGRLPRVSLIYLNLKDDALPFFQDTVIRRALLMGINRQKIIDRLLHGQGIIANGPIFPENWAYYDGNQQVKYDPDIAIDILKKSGYTIPAEGGNVRAKDGISLSFNMMHPATDFYTSIAQLIRDDWSRLGVDVILSPASYEDMQNNYLVQHNFQAALVELNLDRSPDPDPYPFWHQAQISNGQNYSGWDDRQVSEYLEQGRVLADYAERLRRYRNFQVRFNADIPALLLFYPVYSFGISNQIQGVTMGPLYDPSDRFSSINRWYLVTGSTGGVQLTPSQIPTLIP